MRKNLLNIILVVSLTALSASVAAEVGQKRSKCEEGIGCRDEQKKAPDAPKYAPKNDKAPGNMRATSPGLGVGVTGTTRVPGGRMEPLPGSGGYAGSSPAEQAFLNEVCSGRAEQAELEPYQSSRRVVSPELNATACIQLGTRKSVYGPGFKNTCTYPVVFRFCAYKPAPDAWTEAFDCEKTVGGTEIIGPGKEIAAHTADAESIHWAGCRHPEGLGADYKFTAGQGYRFNCMAWQSGKVRDAVSKSKAPACEVAEAALDAAVQAEVEQQRAKLPELVAMARQDQTAGQAAFEQKFAARMKQTQPEAQQAVRQQARQAVSPSVATGANTRRPGTATSTNFSSVCRRNIEKVNQIMERSGLKAYAATGDRFWVKADRLAVQILEPCAAMDESARNDIALYKLRFKMADELCANPQPYQCTEWGNRQYQSQHKAWFEAVEREYKAALANPNGYSADLETGANSATSAKAEACQDKLNVVARQSMRAPADPAARNSPRAQMQSTMWLQRESIRVIQSVCPSEPAYKKLLGELEESFKKTQATCNAMSSTPCSPALP